MTKAVIKLLRHVWIFLLVIIGLIFTKDFPNILFIVLGVSYALFYGKEIIDGVLTIITLSKKK